MWDGPQPQWFWTKGHVKKDAFLAWVSEYVAKNHEDLPWDWLPDPSSFSIANISHEWWHFYPSRRKDITGIYAQVAGRGRGNFAVTVYNLDYPIGDSEDVGLLLQGEP